MTERDRYPAEELARLTVAEIVRRELDRRNVTIVVARVTIAPAWT